jgi:hypothetical protein
MSRLHLIVIGSLVANAALAVVVFLGAKRDTHATTATDSAPTSRIQPVPTSSSPPLAWDQLHGLTPEEFTARLKRHGFPPHVLRAIVQARVAEDFRPRWRALETQSSRPYWRTTGGGGFLGRRIDPREAAARRALSREERSLVQRLVGSEPETAAIRAYNHYRYGDIDSDRIKQVQAIEVDYSDLLAQIRHDSRGVLLQEDRDQIAFLEAEKHADLAALLTPEELTAYELRASPTARRLRSQLAAFDATEEEFIALYEVQRTFDKKYGSGDSALSSEQLRRRREAQSELDQEIAAVLGAERYADYELKTHSSWRAADAWVNQQQLPAPTTSALVSLEREMEQRSRSIRQTRGLSSADRTAQLAALAQEAEARLGRVLNQEQIGAYQAGPGHWLRNLRPSQR